jgi:peptidoglycan/LPS O-acetylase OafA/YrhL
MTFAYPENTRLRHPYEPGLDGIRGWAVLAVVSYHLFGLPGGWMGVDVFFVLSGFLITSALLQDKHNPGVLGRFYTRRLLRIFPLYCLSLILYFCVTVGMGIAHWRQAVPFVFFYQNFVFGFPEYFRAEMPAGLKHFWTLAVEMHFYVFFPALVLFVNRKTLKWVLPVLILSVMCLRGWIFLEGQELASFVITPCRLDGLLTGAWLAYFGPRKTNLPFWLLLLAALTVFIMAILSTDQFSPLYHLGGFTVLSISAAVTVAFSMTKHPFVPLLFENAFLVHIGKLSYGIYVIHYIVDFLIRTNFQSPVDQPVSGIGTSLFSMFLTYLLAVLSYRFVEKPFLRLKSNTYS